MALSRRAGQPDILVAALVHQADVQIARQDYAAARQSCEEALTISRTIEPTFFFNPQVLRQLGEICHSEHDEAEAWHWLQQSLAQSRSTHPPRQVMVTVATIAGLLAIWTGGSRDDRLRATRLWGAVSAL